MKKLLLVSTIILMISCGEGSKKQDVKILTENAYIKLESYEYSDLTNGSNQGKSTEGRTLSVTGSTNFPDGTIINLMTSGFNSSTKEGDMTDTYDDVEVKNGKFTSKLEPWNVTESISFAVFPEKQNEELLEIFGVNGKNIKTDKSYVNEFPEIKFFSTIDYKVNEDLISKIKTGKPKKYKIQKPNELKEPYEKKLAEYINCWKSKDWNSMVKKCQTSQNITTKELKSFFENTNIIGFEVISSREGVKLPSGNTLMVVEFTLDVTTINERLGIQKKYLKANVIQEKGVWGVNSGSTLEGLF